MSGQQLPHAWLPEGTPVVMTRPARRALNTPASPQRLVAALPKLALAMSLAALGLVLPAAPALAAGCDAGSFTAEFNGAAAGSTVVLCGDITVTASDTSLAVPADSAVTLDLNGHTLTAGGAAWHAGIGVARGSALTIEDSSSPSTGRLIADGGEDSAGIGGSHDDSGDITINGGTITATGDAACQDPMGSCMGAGTGAGIGGGGNGSIGDLAINGGTVVAMGTGVSAGIGGGGASGGSNGGSITITAGHVTAIGGSDILFSGAGIGSAGGRTVGPITITGGTVQATGGSAEPEYYSGAGIGTGGSAGGATADITISGGSITATGGYDAAGIGGGGCTPGPRVTINGAGTQVAANGTGTATAIGAGGCVSLEIPFSGATVSVGAGAEVTVHSDGPTVFGGTAGGAFGSLDNTGTIVLASPLIVPGSTAITNNGTLSSTSSINNLGTIGGSGTVDGTGTISNSGAILYTQTVEAGVSVLGNHFQLSFDPAGGSVDWVDATAWSIVDGPTLASVGRSTAHFPTATRTGYAFTGWFLGGADTPAADDTPLPGNSTDGTPVQLALTAGWRSVAPAQVAIVSGDHQTADAGAPFGSPLTVAVADAQNAPVTAGTDVSFTVTHGDASFAGSSTATVATDSRGLAVSPLLTAGATAGAVAVEATVAGVSTPAVFTETVNVPLVPTVVTTHLPDAQVGVPYHQALVAGTTGQAGATGPSGPAGAVGAFAAAVAPVAFDAAAPTAFHWTLTRGALPTGLRLSDDGIISGTPTASGTFAFTVSVNDAATADLSITVVPAAAPKAGGLAATGGTDHPLSETLLALVLLSAGIGVAMTHRRRLRRGR